MTSKQAVDGIGSDDNSQTLLRKPSDHQMMYAGKQAGSSGKAAKVNEQDQVLTLGKRLVGELGEVVKAASKTHEVVDKAQDVVQGAQHAVQGVQDVVEIVSETASPSRPWRAASHDHSASPRAASTSAASTSVASTSGSRQPAMSRVAHLIQANPFEPTPQHGPPSPKSKQPQQRAKKPKDPNARPVGRPRIKEKKDPNAPKKPRGRPRLKDRPVLPKKPVGRPKSAIPKVKGPVGRPQTRIIGPKRQRGRPKIFEDPEGLERPPPTEKLPKLSADPSQSKRPRPEWYAKPGPPKGTPSWRKGVKHKSHWKKAGRKPKDKTTKEPSAELPPSPHPDSPNPSPMKKHRPNDDDGGAGAAGAAAVSKRG